MEDLVQLRTDHLIDSRNFPLHLLDEMADRTVRVAAKRCLAEAQRHRLGKVGRLEKALQSARWSLQSAVDKSIRCACKELGYQRLLISSLIFRKNRQFRRWQKLWLGLGLKILPLVHAHYLSQARTRLGTVEAISSLSLRPAWVISQRRGGGIRGEECTTTSNNMARAPYSFFGILVTNRKEAFNSSNCSQGRR